MSPPAPRRCLGPALLFASMALAGPAGAADTHTLAVIVDDSSSMSAERGRPGNDPRGIAAFAASQLVRFAPQGATLGIFTFGSIRADDVRGVAPEPVFVVRDLAASDRRSRAAEIERVLLDNGRSAGGALDGAHPYWGYETPCLPALTGASRWLRRTAGAHLGTSAVVFLTDGVCYVSKRSPYASKTVADGVSWLPDDARAHVAAAAGEATFRHGGVTYPSAAAVLRPVLGGASLYCIGFGEMSPELRQSCETLGSVFDARRSDDPLAILKAFSDTFDRHEGCRRSTLFFAGVGSDIPEYRQAWGVNLLTQTCPDCTPLEAPEGIDARQVLLQRWSWPDARVKDGGAVVDGAAKARFDAAYAHVRWDQVETLGAMYRAGDRSTLMRPEYLLGTDLVVHEGRCDDLGPLVKDNRSRSGTVCLRGSLSATVPGGSEAATWQTLHLVYTGKPGPEGTLPSGLKVTLADRREQRADPSAPWTSGRETRRRPDMGRGPAPVWSYQLDLPDCSAARGGARVEQQVVVEFGVATPGCPAALRGKTRDLCHGGADADGDGYTAALGDCDDEDAAANPGATEVCDGADNDCDGEVDEGLPDHDGDAVCDDRDPDRDNDGCPRACDDDDFNAETPGEGDCRCGCAWSLASGPPGGCDRAPDGRGWRLTFGDPMAEPVTTRRCRTDPQETVVKCAPEGSARAFRVHLRPLGDGVRLQDPCFRLSGDGVGEGPGWRVDGASSAELDVTLERSAVCGKLGPPGGDPEVVARRYDVRGRLTVEPGAGQEAIADAMPDLDVHLLASFEQSLGFELEGELHQASGDSPQRARVTITPTLGAHAEASVVLAEDLDVALLSDEVSRLADDGEPGSGLRWVDCDTGSALDPTRPLELSPSGSAFCLELYALDTCAGGGLFSFCDQADEAHAVRLRHARITAGERPLDYQVVEQAREVRLTVRRGFMDWWLPGLGYGWWWLVILLHIIVIWGASYTHSRTFGGFRKYRVKNLLAVVGIWLLVCFVYSLSPLWS